jgi:hypothetical protein
MVFPLAETMPDDEPFPMNEPPIPILFPNPKIGYLL